MITHNGKQHIYTCDRCGKNEVVADDDRTDRQSVPGDPLAQRRHDAPVGWVVASLDYVERGRIIYGPHGGKALWCKECGLDAELFAQNMLVSVKDFGGGAA